MIAFLVLTLVMLSIMDSCEWSWTRSGLMQVAGIFPITGISLFISEHVPLAKQTSKRISKYGSQSEVQAVTSRSVRSFTQGTNVDEISQQQYLSFLNSALYRFWKCCTWTPSTHSLLATYTNRYNVLLKSYLYVYAHLNILSQKCDSVMFQGQLTLSSSCKKKLIKALFIMISTEDNRSDVQQSFLSWLPVNEVHVFM